MNNKHYTPTIEEFHVGFEYEQHEDYDNPLQDKEWHKLVFGVNGTDNPENMTYPGSLNIIRVKHLDREDIESLGFKDDVGAGIFFRKRIHTDEEIHLNFDDTILIERCCVMDEYPIEVVFKGKIKNKSVLTQVLKMIGV